MAMFLAARDSGWRGILAGALVFTLAIVSMHFTGVSAVSYRPDPLVPVHNVVVAPFMLAIAVAAVAFSTMALGLAGALLDIHLERQAVAEAKRLRRYVDELEATKHQLLAAKYQAEAGSRSKICSRSAPTLRSSTRTKPAGRRSAVIGDAMPSVPIVTDES